MVLPISEADIAETVLSKAIETQWFIHLLTKVLQLGVRLLLILNIMALSPILDEWIPLWWQQGILMELLPPAFIIIFGFAESLVYDLIAWALYIIFPLIYAITWCLNLALIISQDEEPMLEENLIYKIPVRVIWNLLAFLLCYKMNGRIKPHLVYAKFKI